jgi:hypothetical protein
LTFLAPYWLLAASVIVIPIAIHLWNKRQGKTVKVGSLRWLEASASNRWSSIKLNNFWLLVLRCFILILLAVAMAQPVWEHKAHKKAGTKAIVIGEELLYTSALEPIKPTIDSLLQQGYSLHTYTPKFEQIPQDKWHQISHRMQDSLISHKYSYWDLLPALAARHTLPQDSVLLFTSDQQQYFTGSRPETFPHHIRWIPVTTDNSITWLQTAIQISPDSLLLIIGNSSRDGTNYSKYTTAILAPALTLPSNQKLQLQRQQDTLHVSISGTSSKVLIQTQPLQIAILSDKVQQTEERYLKAALQAISIYTNLPIKINADTTNADWVFWLRDDQLPQAINQPLKNGLNVWVQRSQTPQVVNTSLTGAGSVTVKVYQLNPYEPEQQTQVWTTSNGQPLLDYKTIGRGRIYSFRSGFAPAWSEIGQSAQLPELLLPLLLPQPQATYDYRALDEQQVIPSTQIQAAPADTAETTQILLLKWFVIAAFILLLIERIIANRRSKA